MCPHVHMHVVEDVCEHLCTQVDRMESIKAKVS